MDIKELHSIMPINNIPPVMEHGILSHNLCRKKNIRNHSVAMPEIQKRRARKVIPGGRPLHDYANLYFDAHNPMLSRVRSHNNEICILRISPDILNLADVVIADQNAASDYVKFLSSPTGLELLDYDLICAENWKHPDDQIAEWRHGSIKCAEVLVPNIVLPENILGAYVCSRTSYKQLKAVGFSGTISINGGLFF